ncbi:hypothetical protein PSTG_15057 [Puccinia striiformis f. sp. tritici PST-78]|uniref:Uncharacterized protein n=1 Tax=Puccinia striiformis f. sp. tritici PST-78 TaxID=1165861 RepID=A0A0L0UX87_9BASI|nr:hypothetical protein PSTG_15057 [Puccinia striiformis f. sp. tritici PST-78]
MGALETQRNSHAPLARGQKTRQNLGSEIQGRGEEEPQSRSVSTEVGKADRSHSTVQQCHFNSPVVTKQRSATVRSYIRYNMWVDIRNITSQVIFLRVIVTANE